MAAAQNESVPPRPMGMGWVVVEVVVPQLVGDWSEGHRRAGMAAVGLLHAVHAEGADRVDGELGDVGSHAGPVSGSCRKGGYLALENMNRVILPAAESVGQAETLLA